MRIDTSLAVPLHYVDDPPIATCHWQWVGNILAMRGFPGWLEQLGLAWGCRWGGGGVLFGAASWPLVLNQVCGAVVDIKTFPDPAEARREELMLSASGLPFIVEVDEYYLATTPGATKHVVHAVLVVDRTSTRVRLVDNRQGPRIRAFPAEDYELLRSSPCRGREEPYKLYVVTQPPTRQPPAPEIFASVRDHLARRHARSTAALLDYVGWVRRNTDDIDVCRVAGERYQATKLFRYLAERGVPAGGLADIFAQLTDDWYMVHMLATHARAAEPAHRARVVRLLERLVASESVCAEAVLA